MNAKRAWLEKHQAFLYFGSLLAGAGAGLCFPNAGSTWEQLITPCIAILLYSMFVQIPFLQLKTPFGNRRFLAALFAVNFIAVPVLVWGLAQFLPDQPAVLLGVFLVLLTPCIDYVIVFTQLGRGDEKLMLAATPFLFVVQMALLPLYLWMFIGQDAAAIIHVEPFVEAFAGLIVIPLALALATQLWARRSKPGAAVMDATAWLPVPFMALVLLLVVAAHGPKLYNNVDLIVQVVPVYAGYMIISPLLAWSAARLFRLELGESRALAFSAGTRNSLVVLPFALALPGECATVAAAVIVTQTIVELIGELIYIRFVPQVLMPDRR
ncbi:arsenic resistance protein [Paenibacillaceae bacterium]|nr:arsenic resistance protein [Paenibacillaceae bacterium]